VQPTVTTPISTEFTKRLLPQALFFKFISSFFWIFLFIKAIFFLGVIVFANLKSPKADGIACLEHAGYNDHITAKEKDASISVICYSRPPETSIGQCMVIVTNYELIENLQTHFFMYGVQNLFLVLVAVIILR